jgi:hypothetical protein
MAVQRRFRHRTLCANRDSVEPRHTSVVARDRIQILDLRLTGNEQRVHHARVKGIQ